MTLDEFERLPDDESRTELVRGRLVREPPTGMDHGRLASRVDRRIATFVEEHGLGEVFIAETGFVLFEDPPEESTRFGRMAPDLAVEVVSPSNTAVEILDKTADYLEAGTRLVWVVEPTRRCVTVYRSRNEIRLLREGDELEGYDVLPGFSLPVAEIFGPSTGAGGTSSEVSK